MNYRSPQTTPMDAAQAAQVRKNVAVRLATLELSRGDLARGLGVTHQAVTSRLARMAPVDVAYFATALALPEKALLAKTAKAAATAPVPTADGWLTKAQSLVGTDPDYDDLWEAIHAR